MQSVTLAHKLGTTAHVSPLLLKAKRLGLSGTKELCTLAVQRGCRHYSRGDEPAAELVPNSKLSNAELAVALLTIAAAYDPHRIRCGAAMLSAVGNPPEELARLAKWERSEAVVHYIAQCGSSFEPQNPFWTQLLALLPQCPTPKEGVFPHPTRFITMSGYQRGRGKHLTSEWQRPRAA
jgi:hypothetical protein